MTRVRTDENGKPLPAALQDAVPEFIAHEEPTVRTHVPTAEELDEHLALVSGGYGQGPWPTGGRKGPL